MADPKPILALDLSNDGITLWHLKGATGWVALGQVPLDAPDLQERLANLRGQTGLTHQNPLKAIVRIPRSEVMISRLKLGVFEGDAAVSQARKLIAELTPYPINDVIYDLEAKGVGNMAPVAVAARKTLQEAEDFAAQHGFEAVYFSTEYEPREFPREPRFYLKNPKKSILPMVSRIAAAAAVGLTLGYFGYVQLSTPKPDSPPQAAVLEQPAVEKEKKSAKPHKTAKIEKTTPVIVPPSDQEPDFSAPQTATLIAPPTTEYPKLVIGDIGRSTLASIARLARPGQQKGTPPPEFQAESSNHKTDSLALADALRDLPEVALNDEVIAAQQEDMQISLVTQNTAPAPFTMAAFTPPETDFNGVFSSVLAQPEPGYRAPPQEARQEAAPPPPPPALIIAEPGTLTPTPEGTLGPENILIFSGRPQIVAVARPEYTPPPDPLAQFRPRTRPAGLVSEDVLAALAPPLSPEDSLAPGDPQDIAQQPQQPNEQTGAEQAPQLPQIAVQSDIQPAAEQLAETSEPDAAATAERPAAAQSLLALADPELRRLKPRQRPGTLVVVEPVPDVETPEIANSLLALADPALAGRKPRIRPASLRITPVTSGSGLLALANPALSNFRAKKRPRGLKIVKLTPEVTPNTTPTPVTTPLKGATKLAVAASPKPKMRPAKFASLTGIDTSGGTTRATAKTPKSAKGSSKPTAGTTVAIVARAATEKSRFSKKKMSLIGVFGTPNSRRALVRMPSGRYVKVKAGDRLSGWQISAIGESTLRIRKGSKNQVLRMP